MLPATARPEGLRYHRSGTSTESSEPATVTDHAVRESSSGVNRGAAIRGARTDQRGCVGEPAAGNPLSGRFARRGAGPPLRVLHAKLLHAKLRRAKR
jgi:hypothetical protein